MERLLENVLTGLDRTSVLDFAQYSISSRGLWDSLPAPLVDDIVKKARDISFTKSRFRIYMIYFPTKNAVPIAILIKTYPCATGVLANYVFIIAVNN